MHTQAFAFLAGMAAGFATGILHTVFGIPGILASILTQIGLYSVNLGIMGKSNQAINVLQYKLVASLRYVTGEGSGFFFVKLILAAIVLIAIIYWFFGTELGAAIRATGCNPQMASAQGINTSFNKVLALMISNGLVGLCGGIYAQYQGAADVNMGRGAIVIGLAAVIISEVIFGKFCAGKKIAFALIFAFLAGMAAGFVTGILHTVFGIPGILASILTQIGLYSVNLGIMGKSNQAINVLQYKLVASLRYVTGEGSGFFFVKLILAAIVLIAIIYWFFGTELGAAIRATGCNPQMASAQGINTSFNKVLALMISNGLVGLCGGIYAQYQGAADVNMGRGAIVIGLAAVIISEVIFGKFCAGKKIAFALTLGAVFIGAIIYYIVIAFVLWLKMPSDYMKLFSAVVVACFLAVPYMKEKYFKKRRTA